MEDPIPPQSKIKPKLLYQEPIPTGHLRYGSICILRKYVCACKVEFESYSPTVLGCPACRKKRRAKKLRANEKDREYRLKRGGN